MTDGATKATEPMQLRTCTQCGWVHFGVTLHQAHAEAERFVEWYNKQEEATKELFGNKPLSIVDFHKCFRCGAHWTQMRTYRAGDCPDGCTLQSILIGG